MFNRYTNSPVIVIPEYLIDSISKIKTLKLVLVATFVFWCSLLSVSDVNANNTVVELIHSYALENEDQKKKQSLEALIHYKPAIETISESCNELHSEELLPAQSEQGLKIFTSIVVGVLPTLVNVHPETAPKVGNCLFSSVQIIYIRGVESKASRNQLAQLLGAAAWNLGEKHPDAIINFNNPDKVPEAVSPKNIIKRVHKWINRTKELDVQPMYDAYYKIMLSAQKDQLSHLCGLDFLWPSNPQRLEKVRTKCEMK